MRTQGSTAVPSPALLCNGVDTKPLSLVIGLRDKQSHKLKTVLAASPRIFGSKSTLFPCLEQSGDVAEDEDGERTVLVALLEPLIFIQLYQEMVFPSFAGANLRPYFIQWIFFSVIVCPISLVLCLAEKLTLPGLSVPTFMLLQKAASSGESKWEDGFLFIPF